MARLACVAAGLAAITNTACSGSKCEVPPQEMKWASRSAGSPGQITAIVPHPFDYPGSLAITDEGSVISATWHEYWGRTSAWSITSGALRGIARLPPGSALLGDVLVVGDAGLVLRSDFRFDPPVWTPELVPVTVNLNATWVQGTEPGGVWVVGDAGTVLHHDGTGFAVETLGPERLLSVWGTEDEVWAVGEGTDVVYHHVMGAWQREDPALGVELVDVAGRSNEDVWFVGKRGAVVRWQGEGFELLDSGVTTDLTAIAVAEQSYIVGEEGFFLYWLPRPTRVETPLGDADFTAIETGYDWRGTGQTLAVGGLLLRYYWPDPVYDICGGS